MFDEIINRRGTYSTQWDYIEDRFGKGTKDLIPFSISDTDFKCPEPILNMIIEKAKHGIFGYSRWNHDDYKLSITNWYLKRYNTGIDKNWIAYSPNVIYSISVILKILLHTNKKIMTHTPRYDGFNKILKPYILYEVELKENNNGVFETDFQKIEAGFKDGVKVFLLCNPENPTGKVWKYEELKILIDLCEKYDVILISDDIHMDISRKEVTPVLKIDTKRCIIVSSPSKTFNTPALGGSYVIIPISDLFNKFIYHIKEVDALGSPTILGVLSTIVSYNQCDEWVNSLNQYVTKNCEYVERELNNYKHIKATIPEGTYLMWLDFKNVKIDINKLHNILVTDGKVALMSGEVYGDKTRIRLNVGCPLSKVKIAVDAIKKSVEKLTKDSYNCNG